MKKLNINFPIFLTTLALIDLIGAIILGFGILIGITLILYSLWFFPWLASVERKNPGITIKTIDIWEAKLKENFIHYKNVAIVYLKDLFDRAKVRIEDARKLGFAYSIPSINLRGKDAPCKDCQDRTVIPDCHGTCPAYLKFDAENKARREERKRRWLSEPLDRLDRLAYFGKHTKLGALGMIFEKEEPTIERSEPTFVADDMVGFYACLKF